MKTSSSLWTSPPSHPPERGNLSLYLTDDNRHITKCHPCNATYFSGSGLICWPLTIESEDLLPYFADQEVEVVQDQWLSQGPTQIMWVLSSVLFFFFKASQHFLTLMQVWGPLPRQWELWRQNFSKTSASEVLTLMLLAMSPWENFFWASVS